MLNILKEDMVEAFLGKRTSLVNKLKTNIEAVRIDQLVNTS